MRSRWLLVAGDTTALALFGAVGLASHEKSIELGTVARSMLPFIVSWLLVGSAFGMFGSDPVRGRLDPGRFLLAWLAAGLGGDDSPQPHLRPRTDHGILCYRPRRQRPLPGRLASLLRPLARPRESAWWHHNRGKDDMNDVNRVIINVAAIAIVAGLVAMMIAIVLTI